MGLSRFVPKLPEGLMRRGGAAPERAPKPRTVEPPIRLVIRYVQASTERDAVGIAKGLIQKRFDSPGHSWYAVAPYGRGFFVECHEGGNGVSYLPQIVEALAANNAEYIRIPDGDHVYEIAIKDQRPEATRLSEQRSREMLSGAVQFPTPTGRMLPAIKEGEVWIQIGAVFFAVGAITLMASIAYYAFTAPSQQIARAIDPAQLPDQQWSRVSRVPDDKYVERLRFDKGQWTVDYADSAPSARKSPQETSVPGPAHGSTQMPANQNRLPPAQQSGDGK